MTDIRLLAHSRGFPAGPTPQRRWLPSAYPACIGTCLTTEDRSSPGNRVVAGRDGRCAARRCRLSRPATSQHLKVLREADLVSVRRQGNRRFYRVRADRLAELRAMLDEFWGSRLASLRAGWELPGRRSGRDRRRCGDP